MISHKHKCIFIHIPKTAGTSINSFFHPGVHFHYAKPDYQRLFGWCPIRRIHMQHATSQQLIETELISEEIWRTYYKFTFVRNPWDRAYSDFQWIQEFSGVRGSFSNYINRRKEFNKILNDNTTSRYLGDHLLPQTDFFEVDGYLALDFVGRFENFKKDIRIILQTLQIEDFFDLRFNVSKREKNYANFYTKKKKKLVESHFQKDIIELNYEFSAKRTGLNKLKNFL